MLIPHALKNIVVELEDLKSQMIHRNWAVCSIAMSLIVHQTSIFQCDFGPIESQTIAKAQNVQYTKYNNYSNDYLGRASFEIHSS